MKFSLSAQLGLLQVLPALSFSLCFEGTSGKGSNKDSLHYVPESILAATLPALLSMQRPCPWTTHTADAPPKTWE